VSDLPSRVLSTATRLLPTPRKEWGAAMAAELAAITERGERRRFALGCVRAVLFSGPMLRSLAGHLFLFGFAAVAVLRALSLTTSVRVEAIALVAVVGALAWWGRHAAPFGPVAPGRAARLVRLAGYGSVMITIMVLLSTGTNDSSGWWFAAFAISVYLAGFLRATAQPVTGALSLPTAAALALSGLILWWVPMLLWHVSAFVSFVAAVAVVCAGSALGSRAGNQTRGLVSGLAAATAMLLLVFLAAALTFRLWPGLAPNVSPPGLNGIARAENNRAESLDPYVADFLLGALLSTILIVLSVLPPQAVSSSTEPVRDLRTRSRTGIR
jgi:hypothetical protein